MDKTNLQMFIFKGGKCFFAVVDGFDWNLELKILNKVGNNRRYIQIKYFSSFRLPFQNIRALLKVKSRARPVMEPALPHYWLFWACFCGYVSNFPCDWRIFYWGKFCLKLYIYSYKNVGLINIFSGTGIGENKPLPKNHLEFWSQWDRVVFWKDGPVQCYFYYYILNNLLCRLLNLLWIWNTFEKRGEN